MDNLEFAKRLEVRTERLADDVYALCRALDKVDQVVKEIISQLVRSAGSVGSNYIEANESLSRKDFFHRIRICRKESRESRFWLKRLLILLPEKHTKEVNRLISESSEFILIFSKILTKA